MIIIEDGGGFEEPKNPPVYEQVDLVMWYEEDEEKGWCMYIGVYV